MRELLFRLMKKLPDGSFKVVGYEKHESGKIYHAKLLETVVIEGDTTDVSGWGDISYVYSHDGTKETMFCVHYIPHDRKDQYPGVEIDGVKVFERDRIQHENYDPETIKWSDEQSCFVVGDIELPLRNYKLENHKITGIEGVTNRQTLKPHLRGCTT